MRTLRLAVAILAASLAGRAAAQNLRVVPVPYAATDPTVPHFAYNGHATTFKAIARGGNGTYLYEWDFQGDGVYDFSATTTNRYNLSTRFTFPNQAVDTTFVAKVRVTSGGQTVTGSYPLRVFSEVPAAPSLANDRQLQVMRSVAIDDGLWYLHNQMARSGDEENALTGAQITGNVGGTTTAAAGGFLAVLGMNGHFPAFPGAYLGELPDPADNTQRWRDDPYAEDAARLVNYLLTQATVVSVAGQDEANLTGFYPEVTAEPIPGTDDGIGIFIGSAPGDQSNGYHAAALMGLARANLAGYVAQVGDMSRILGRRFEHVVQQMVDALVWSQNDGGSYPGSWYYTPNAGPDMLGEFWGGTILPAEALLVAERAMGRHGVVVPNLAKARLASYIVQNVNACPGAGLGAGPLYGGSWSTSYDGVCDHALTAAHVVTHGWLGSNLASTADARVAFPSYSGLTRGQLRAYYDGTMNFIGGPQFAASQSTSIGWDIGFVDSGDFNRVDGRGNHWSMVNWTRAARAVEPEIVNFGSNNHARLFAAYFVRNQAADGGWNWQLGATNSYHDSSVGPAVRAAWAVEVLSREGLAPFAIGTVSQSTAPEGTPLQFSGASAGEGGTYLWAFGNGATAEGANVTYAYPDNGNFNATLTVAAPGGVSVATVQITVTNVAPVASAGPDRVVNEGSPLALAGTFTDPGAADTWTYRWSFGDATTANVQNTNKTWADNGVFNVGFRVTDDDGGTSEDFAIVTVQNVAPSVTSTPPATASEGAPLSYTLAFTDPGPADTHACTAPVKPAGATLTGCTIAWTPSYADAAAPVPFRLCVTDDDGGSACQTFEVSVAALDADADGLPDAWEVRFFGGTAAEDGAGDPDLDGVTNLDEFLAGSDPTVWEGPGAPVLVAPACGARVPTARPTLVAGNALDPRAGTTLTYEFEVHEDAGATSLAAAGHLVPEGLGSTSWQVDVTLEEDRTYYWRARAGDGVIFGPWSAADCPFVVNAVIATLSVADADVGTACDAFGNGGQRTRTGLDDGSGGGVADDGILQPGEVDATLIVCNGADGTDGTDGATGPQGPAGPSGGCGSAPGSVTLWPALLSLAALALRPRGRREPRG